MASESEGKREIAPNSAAMRKQKDWVILLLRLVALFATASATIVMAVNKQSKTFVVATIGNNPVKATLTAKFGHTPAFIFFVIANGMASLHNWMMIVLDTNGHKFDYKGLHFAIIAILDVLNVALAAAGDGAAIFMADLGRNGNKHARWDKICDKFDTFCDHSAGALVASFIGLCLLLVITVMSITKLHNNNKPFQPNNTSNVVAP